MRIYFIVFWIIVIVTAAYAVVQFRKFSRRISRQNGTQIDFIKEQYDKGELTKKQYEQLVNKLSK